MIFKVPMLVMCSPTSLIVSGDNHVRNPLQIIQQNKSLQARNHKLNLYMNHIYQC